MFSLSYKRNLLRLNKELMLYHVLLLVSSFLNKTSSKKHEESVFNPALVISSGKNRPSYGTNKGTHKHTNTQVKRERIASPIRWDLTVVKKKKKQFPWCRETKRNVAELNLFYISAASITNISSTIWLRVF